MIYSTSQYRNRQERRENEKKNKQMSMTTIPQLSSYSCSSPGGRRTHSPEAAEVGGGHLLALLGLSLVELCLNMLFQLDSHNYTDYNDLNGYLLEKFNIPAF